MFHPTGVALLLIIAVIGVILIANLS